MLHLEFATFEEAAAAVYGGSIHRELAKKGGPRQVRDKLTSVIEYVNCYLIEKKSRLEFRLRHHRLSKKLTDE